MKKVEGFGSVSLNRSSVSFSIDEKPKIAMPRWSKAWTRVAKVGKGGSMLRGQRPLALILSAQQRFPNAEVVIDAAARAETVLADEEKAKAIAFQEIDKGI
ncbi:hypothetical protein Tco_0668246 [Tanacetum coccineum]